MAKKQALLDPRQAKFLQAYLEPTSPTFGNCYQSALNAGYDTTYAKNLLNLAPKWLLTFIDKTQVSEQEIIQGIKTETEFLSGTKDSRAAQVRLKAWELLARNKRMLGTNDAPTSVTAIQIRFGSDSETVT